MNKSKGIFVECQLCHKTFRGGLNNLHLHKTHKINPAKYASRFPEQDIWIKYSKRCPICNKVLNSSVKKFCSRECFAESSKIKGFPNYEQHHNGRNFGQRRQLGEFTSPGMTGKNHSKKTKKRLRETSTYNFNHSGSFGYEYFVEDLGHCVRSGWEANIARLLKFLGIEYVYEPKVFSIPKIGNYLPDFYLPQYDLYLEVKGHWRAWKRVNKVYAFAKQGLGSIALIDNKKYYQIRNLCKHIVPDWDKAVIKR